VEAAREQVGALIGAEANEIIFTSGATESNNIAIKGAARFCGRGWGMRGGGSSPWRPSTNVCWRRWGDLAEEGFEPVFLPVRADGAG